MTDKIQRFIDEYMVDSNGADAVRRAGYAVKNAKKYAYILLSRKDVQDAISVEREKQKKRLRIDADYVVTRLMRIAERSMEEESWDAAQANRSLELLGKHLGIFTDRTKTEITGPGGGPVQQAVQVTFVRPKNGD